MAGLFARFARLSRKHGIEGVDPEDSLEVQIAEAVSLQKPPVLSLGSLAAAG